jgi:opacity protein-like surface antigen
MTLRLPSTVALLFSWISMASGGQMISTVHDSTPGQTPNQIGLPADGTAPIGSTAYVVSVTKEGTVGSLLAQDSVQAVVPEFTVVGGIAVTPDRKATEAGTWNQESRNGPSIGVEYQAWKGVFTELNYVNTNTRLQNYAINTWTMNRLSLDSGYEHSWRTGKLSPFVKLGAGVMVLVSGQATDHTSAGLDKRMELLTGAGLRYRLSNHVSAVLEYEGRIIRNPDFSDHSWKPERNFLSEGKIGISYAFNGSVRSKALRFKKN